MIQPDLRLNLPQSVFTEMYTSLQTVLLFLWWCSRRGAAVCDKYQIVNRILEPPTLTLSTFLLNLRKLAAQSFTDSSTRKWFSKVLLEKNQKENYQLELVHTYLSHQVLVKNRLQVLMSTICFNDQARAIFAVEHFWSS